MSNKRILHTLEKSEHGNNPDLMFWCPGCKCGHGVWTTPTGEKVAWFADPDGNTLSLTQDA